MSDVSILVLPPERWRDSKRLRLEALLAEPSAYASSYEDELSFADEVWVKRVNAAFTRDHSIALYAEIGGRLVGMVGTSWSDRLKMRHVAEVYAVYVKPSHRGKGIGKALMRRLLDELKALPQIEKVKLGVTDGNQAAVALYLHLGFEIVGQAKRELQVDGRYYDLYHMELQLAREKIRL